MARLSTREEFRKYILFKLGSPLLDALPIDTVGESCTTATTGTSGTEETLTYQTTGGLTNSACSAQLKSTFTQLDLCIDDALDYYQEFGSEAGNERAIMYVQLKKHQSMYDVPACVVTMEQPLSRGNSSNFDTEEGSSGVGLFSFESQFGPLGTYSFLEGGGGGDNLLTYEIAMQYTALLDLRYSLKYEVNFNQRQKTMMVFPTPDAGDDGRYIIQLCQIRVPDTALYSDIWVQEYAVALAMIQIGQNLSLYTGLALADGSEFNAQHYLDRGFEERDRLKEALQLGFGGVPPAGSFFCTG